MAGIGIFFYEIRGFSLKSLREKAFVFYTFANEDVWAEVLSK